MPAGGRSTVRSRRLGRILRGHRELRRLDQGKIAEVIAVSTPKVSRIESGQGNISILELRTLMDFYGIHDSVERDRLEALARASTRRGWWLDYESVNGSYADHISLEDEATFIRTYHTVYVPGLLQTEEYLQGAVSANERKSIERAEQLREVRRKRQRSIFEKGTPLSYVLWEPVIMYSMGGEDRHRRQLERLVEVMELPQVSIRILRSFSHLIDGMGTAFVGFSFDNPETIEAVTIEGIVSTQIHEEPEEVRQYQALHSKLLAECVTKEESLALIKRRLAGKE